MLLWLPHLCPGIRVHGQGCPLCESHFPSGGFCLLGGLVGVDHSSVVGLRYSCALVRGYRYRSTFSCALVQGYKFRATISKIWKQDRETGLVVSRLVVLLFLLLPLAW